MGQDSFTLFLAGDAIITLPWSQVDRREFLELIGLMRTADVTIVNLETVIHSFRGYAQADSGGTWTASPPIIASELAWAGVNMVSHANNHAFDYGTDGVLETHEHITANGIMISGSGEDLQTARAPGWFEVKGKAVAHLSAAATFVPYGRASRSRPDMRGRPGVNPLTVMDHWVIGIPNWLRTVMRATDGLLGNDQSKYEKPNFIRFGKRFTVGRHFSLEWNRRLDKVDRASNIKSVEHAAAQADITVVSIHSHDEAPWLRLYVSDVIAAGADIVHVHGVHEVRGIEIRDGRAVFYGLGNFVFQTAQIKQLPAEAYEAVGLDDVATPMDILKIKELWGQSFKPGYSEAVAANLHYRRNRLETIRLIPIDLQFGADLEDSGRPRLANAERGRRVIEEIARQSSRFGTIVEYDPVTNTGSVHAS